MTVYTVTSALDDGGPATLRSAIAAATAAPHDAGWDCAPVVEIDSSLASIQLINGEIPIDLSTMSGGRGYLTIIGLLGFSAQNKVVLGVSDRHFLVSNANLRMANLRLSGGLEHLGGSMNIQDSSVEIVNSRFDNNVAVTPPELMGAGVIKGHGGAIYATTDDDTVETRVTLRNVAFEENQAEDGGGALAGQNVDFNVEYSSFVANSAENLGGAIYAACIDADISSELTITNSSLLYNAVNGAGGGSAAGGSAIASGFVEVYVDFTTIANNTISTDAAPAVDPVIFFSANNLFTAPAVRGLHVHYSVIADNVSEWSGAPDQASGLHIQNVGDPFESALVSINRSIVSWFGSDVPNAYGGTAELGSGCMLVDNALGTIKATSIGGELESGVDRTCFAGLGAPYVHDAKNGRLVAPLMMVSTARDRGPLTTKGCRTTLGAAVPFDQRAAVRPVASRCDAGAFEYAP